ncbi:MAG: hypothetical protein ACFFBZ_03055 [Promethearchaeota archaeon]
MTLDKKILSKPRCDNCGARIFRTRGIPALYNLGKVPSYCPRCGAQISVDKKNHLVRNEKLLWLLWCIIFNTIVIVTLVIILK